MRYFLLLVASLPLLARAQSFSAPVRYSAGNTPAGLAIADFNNDGYPDVAAAAYNTGSAAVLLNKKDGTFAPYVYYNSSASTTYNELRIAAGDVNGDKLPDLVITNSYSKASVLLNKGNGTFAPFVAYGLGSIAVTLALADMNGDGYADIVTSNSLYYNTSSPGTVSVLLNKRDGTFADAVLYPTGSPGQVTGTAVGDVDGDGYPDVVTSYYNGTQVGVLRNNRDGTLATAVAYQVGGPTPGRVRIGDVDRDGRADLVVTSVNRLCVLRQQADGSFGAPTLYNVGSTTSESLSGLTLADVNGDTYPDAVMGLYNYSGDSPVCVLLNQRNGTFGPIVRFLGSSAVTDLDVADVNRDGKPDILVINLNNFGLEVRLNQTTFLATRPGLLSATALAVYPNPAHGPATLAYELKAPATVSAEVFDALGRPVATLAHDLRQGAGAQSLPVPQLAAGLYTVRLVHAGGSEVRKLAVE